MSRGDYETRRTDGVTFGDYVDVLRRHRWFIFVVAALVFIPAMIYTMRQQPTYQASARVIQLGTSGATGLNSTEIDRRAQTDASLARIPSLAAGVLSATGAEGSPEDFLDKSSVTASPSSDVLTFTVRDPNAALAVNLANAYARAFSRYRGELGQAALTRAKTTLADSIKQTETALAQAKARANGAPSPEVSVLSQRYASLLDQQRRLLSTEAADESSLVVVPATRAVRGGAQTVRNGLLALAFGLLLGAVLAFVREAFDSRIRTAEEFSEQLGLPLLGRIPSQGRSGARPSRPTMLEQPRSPDAEPFRILRTNVDFANRPFGAHTIMFASPGESDSRTELLANLGIAFARAGRHVTLVDLDLRSPSLGKLFGLRRKRGITDVAMKRTRLTQALANIPITSQPNEASAEEWTGAGTLEVLPAGTTPPDPGDFVGMQPLADVVRLVGERSDLVLIDAPPLLEFGDAVALSANVDAIVVVVTLGAISRSAGDELRRILDVCPAPKLGYVLAGLDSQPSGGVKTAASTPGAHQRTPPAGARGAEFSDIA